MPTQAFTYLELGDGTDSVLIADGSGGLTSYFLVDSGWAPAIAGKRRSAFAGYGPHEDVVETITIDISQSTAALCYDKLATVARVTEKATRFWRDGERITPVTLKYAPMGSTISSTSTPLQALVLGGAMDDSSGGVALPTDLEDRAGMLFEIPNITLKVTRRGAWTGASDTTATSSASANSSTVLTRAFGTSHPTPSPVDITIGGFTVSTTPTIKAGFLCVGPTSDDVQVASAASMTTTGWTSVNESANLAPFTNVLRYTPTGTAPGTSATQVASTVLGSGPLAIIACVRNNSGSTSFQLHMNLISTTGTTRTPDVVIDTSSTQPRLIPLGIVVAGTMQNISLTAQATAASGSLDISHLIFVNLKNETCAILAHDDIPLATLTTNCTINATFNPIADASPKFFAAGQSAVTLAATYRGPLPFLTSGQNIYCLWASTNGQYWVFTNTSNAVVNVTLTATRYRAYLTPQ